MEILDGKQIQALVARTLLNSTNEQIIDVWNNNFHENENKILLKPFRFICERINWNRYKFVGKSISKNQNDPQAILEDLTYVFFDLYCCNSSDIKGMQKYIILKLDIFKDLKSFDTSINRIAESIIIPTGNMIDYLKTCDWIECYYCDGILIFFKKEDYSEYRFN